MFEVMTDRLFIFTNMTVDNGQLKYTERNMGKSIVQLEASQNGDNEFAILSKENISVRFGGVGIVIKNDAKVIEIKFSIKDEYQRKGYITEALYAIVQWIFTLTYVERIEAQCIHKLSAHILQDKIGFKFDRIDEQNSKNEWYVLTRSSYVASYSPDSN